MAQNPALLTRGTTQSGTIARVLSVLQTPDLERVPKICGWVNVVGHTSYTSKERRVSAVRYGDGHPITL